MAKKQLMTGFEDWHVDAGRLSDVAAWRLGIGLGDEFGCP